MDQYVTGAVIRQLRESRGMTQAQLAGMLDVSDKAVSKWETGKGFPDISLLEPLSAALGVSVMELLSGDRVTNQNRSANMLRSRFYVCPLCGNVIHGVGQAVVSCCGVTLPPLEAEEPDEHHRLSVEPVEDEHFIQLNHPMTKTHYISFLAYLTGDRCQMIRFYPEGNGECRLRLTRGGMLYYYCNRHGLFRQKV